MHDLEVLRATQLSAAAPFKKKTKTVHKSDCFANKSTITIKVRQ